jgi:predicted nucleotidyltransferase
VHLTSIPGLLVLKLIAWLDRNVINNKDADDIFMLLQSYASAGNEDRLYEQDHEVFEAVGHDLTLAGAYLLGRDAAQIARDETVRQVGELLTSKRCMDRLLSQIVGSATLLERTQTVENILRHFRSGFLETTDSP